MQVPAASKLRAPPFLLLDKKDWPDTKPKKGQKLPYGRCTAKSDQILESSEVLADMRG
jgi:hypothetical protein